MQSFSTELILLGPVLKNTSYTIQFFHVLFQFQQFYQINLYELIEEIMGASIAEVMNLFTTSNSKTSVEEKSTLSL